VDSLKIVVTGGSRKLGRWTVRELVARSHQVTVFDRDRASDVDGVRQLTGDVEDLGQVFGAVAGADAVIHLAAIYSHSIMTNEVTFRTNVMGAFNVHEAAFRLGLKRVVTLSSEAVLGWAPGSWEREHVPEYLPLDEDHPCRPQDCYGLSKVATEVIAWSYTDKCGMQTVLIRAPWIVSPEQLVELRRSNGRKPAGFALYHYIDVRDLALACCLAAERPLEGSHTLFVGSGDSLIAEPLCSLFPRLMPAIGDRAKTLTGTQAPVSIARARTVLGWSPQHFWRTAEA
jgi:nucleoside-diphosphate-sugar epimerase